MDCLLYEIDFLEYDFLLKMCIRVLVHYAMLNSLWQSTYFQERQIICLWITHERDTNSLGINEVGRRVLLYSSSGNGNTGFHPLVGLFKYC